MKKKASESGIKDQQRSKSLLCSIQWCSKIVNQLMYTLHILKRTKTLAYWSVRELLNKIKEQVDRFFSTVEKSFLSKLFQSKWNKVLNEIFVQQEK